jgi:formiminotetrahydrofolate cyclodeaminase
VQFEIVGVAKAKGSIFGQSQDNFLIIPIDTYFKIWGARNGMGFAATALDHDHLARAQEEARMLLRSYRHLRPKEDDTFSMLTSDALLDFWNQLTGAIAATAVAVVSVFLVVGGVVIMNIMLAVVTERTHEIGIRKSVGARKRDILNQFLVESALLSASGGMIGVLIAWIVAVLVRTFTPVPMSVPVMAVVVGVTLSAAVGLFFGIYPAHTAAQLDPIEALLREMGTVAERQPDLGSPVCHPTAGATVVGARQFLIAYNINLGTPDVSIAKKIAKTIRFSSGGFRYVKSMGVTLGSRNLAQVSINLTDFEQTPMHLVFETVRREAERYGVPVVGSEIVGLIPKKAIELAAEYFLRFENFKPELVLEHRIAEAVEARGGLPDFLDALAAPTATPGGGSASAAAAAMSAALGAMVTRLAKQDSGEFEDDRRFFTEAVDRDAEAFQKVMAAYKRPKDERAPYVEEALHGAAEVPLQVYERGARMERRLEALQIPSKFGSDLAVAKALIVAAKKGVLENVRINLESIQDQGFRASVEARIKAADA